jgi:hydrogenase expression/formation protein HypD
MLGILEILKQNVETNPHTENLYTRVVTQNGNLKALSAIDEAYSVVDANWRGIGTIPNSGLELASQFEEFNIRLHEDIPLSEGQDIPPGCRCADVILGKIYPSDCSLFNKKCTPENPVGPCMVGTEGTCAIHAKYGGYLEVTEDD